ncbi:Ribosome-releasing factor 2, mitochondrial [Coemansia sp. RSA 2336]|nr:Ribosome-releasing factor 2, mitochondrial [Coemansia sp. RSA 2336]
MSLFPSLERFTYSVKPQTIAIDGLDKLTHFVYIPFFYFYENSNRDPNFMSFKQLQGSLHETLHEFPLLAGTAYTDKGALKVSIDRGSINLPSISHITTSLHFKEFAAANYNLSMLPECKSKTPFFRSKIGKWKMADIQIIRFQENSGVAMFISIAHIILDGFGFTTFVNRWAETCCQMSNWIVPVVPKLILSHDRQLLRDCVPESQMLPGSLVAPTFARGSLVSKAFACLSLKNKGRALRLLNAAGRVSHARFMISNSQLDKIRNSVREALDEPRISNNDVILALLSMCFAQSVAPFDSGASRSRVRKLKDRLTPSMFETAMTVDVRPRLSQLQDKGYCGNAVVVQRMHTARSMLQQPISIQSLAPVAKQVRKTTDSVDGQYIRGFMDALDTKHDAYARPAAGGIRLPHKLLVTNHTRLPHYNADFGGGSPVWVNPIEAAFPNHTIRQFTTSRLLYEKVRNIGIIAHIDAGKTTTTERMLHYAGFTRKIGNVDNGDTVMDYLREERERGITIQSAAITFGWRDHQIHLIDTPGHVDFTVEVERAVRVLDGAVAVIDAVAGVQAQTMTVWRQTEHYQIPRVVFINKMDREGASWKRSVEDIETKLQVQPLVLIIPEAIKPMEGQYTVSELQQWLDVVSMERICFDLDADKTGATVRRQKLTPTDKAYGRASQARVQLVEALAELDSTIVDAFLAADGDHMQVSIKDVQTAIRRVTLNSQAVPVLMGASFRNVGVQPLLDAVIDYLPAPSERPMPPELQNSGNKDQLVAFAFKVIANEMRGPMVFVRVYAGTLDARSALVNGTQGGVRERATKLLQMYADVPEEIPRIGCGHIGVILGLKNTRTGDTLLHPHHRSLKSARIKAPRERSSALVLMEGTQTANPVGLQLHGIKVPPPVFFCAVEADSPQDEQALADALCSLMLEDPSLHVSYNQETGQTLLSGMGELHLEVIRGRLQDMRVRASFGDMRVSFREMPSQASAAHFDYAKEIAGRPAQAGLSVSIEPGEDDNDSNSVEVNMPAELVPKSNAEAVVSPLMYREIHDAIRDGIHAALLSGPLLGFPLVRTHVQVTNVDFYSRTLSTPTAFRACAVQAMQKALAESSATLLEPLARLRIECPAKSVGAVLSDLNGVRRGRVVSLDDLDAGNGKSLVAEVNLSTMIGYSSALRSLTAGAGTFSMEVVGFGAVPRQQQEQIIKEGRGYY